MNRREMMTTIGGGVALTIAAASAKAVATPAPSASMLTDPRVAQAWQRYYAMIDEARALIEGSPQFRDAPEQRAKGYHTLMEMQAQVYNFAIAPRLIHPRIFRNTGWQTEIYTLGGNGADFDYRQTFLDGRQTYRLSGNMRDSRLVLAQLANALPGTPGSEKQSNHDFSKFAIEKDGSFEIMLSGQRQPGNWIPLDGTAPFQWIQFRPTVEGWDKRPAELFIERVSAIGPEEYATEEFDPTTLARRIDMATGFGRYMITDWTVGFYQKVLKNNDGVPNIFNPITPHIAGQVGSPAAQYTFATFDLADDDALIFELNEVPDGAYWSFELFDVWLRSIDFRTRQTALNSALVAEDADGKLRFVVSKRDPGIANWLDTGERTKGQIVLRNYRATKQPVISSRVVKVGQIAALLKRAKRVAPAERQQQLNLRRLAYLSRQGE